MRHGSLFSGIGGFDLASEWMGWENMFHCEWDKFGQRVLKYYWSNAKSYGDITKTDFTIWRGEIDIITGGFPCQPYSMAGKRKGKEDDRHLWPEMLRAIREVQPYWVVGENVPGIINWSRGLVFHEVQTDLEAEGYEVFPVILPACSVNAPHRRDRVWFIAYNNKRNREKNRLQTRGEVNVDGIKGARTTSNANGLRGNKKHELQQTKLREQFGKRWASTNTKITGTGQNNGRLRQGARGINDRETTDSKITPDPDSTRTGEQLRTDGFRKEEDKGRKRFSQFEPREDSGDVTDTTRSSIKGELSKRQGEGKFRRCSGEITTDTDSRRQSSKEYRQKESGQFTKEGSPNNWENFPTQSPLCGGDDGIPRDLVDITFPKWRNESIKAMGNAIVPQVAYQIFKAIEEFNNLKSF